MNRKFFAILGTLALLVAMIPAATVSASPPLPDYKPVDVGPRLRDQEASASNILGGLEALTPAEADQNSANAMAALSGTPYQDCAVDAKSWLSLDDYSGQYFFTTFYLVSQTAESELWVQTDLSWPSGDPRATPEVTCEQADYMLSEFDNNMYPTEVDFFGAPDFHDGSASLLEALGYVPAGYYDNSAGRQVVLVSNIQDDSYYDYTYPNYIAGFYSSTFESYFDRNVMSIDAFDWANRVGPDGSRPHLYEGTFAHEYQHLLHDDYDSDEENFINEGLSMFAEFLTGYAEGNDAYSTFEALPENSLVAWGDQGGREIVADYGIAFLWHMYLYEHFGEAFIQDEFHNPLNGISSLNSSLANTGHTETFAEVFHDFAVANLIDSDQNNYQYGFENHDVNIDIGTVNDPNPDAYDTPGAPPWGADYIPLGKNVSGVKRFMFNGIDFNPMAWTSDGDMLYGGDGDLIDNFMIADVDLSGVTGATLTFDTYFDIEYGWDYGFVQVSTDGGSTWTSLSNADTCSVLDPDAHPKVIDNVPGFTGTSGDACDDSTAPSWITTSFDLSAYDGQDILVAFRYVTDWGTTYDGWYVDNINIAGVFTSDGSSTDGFVDLNRVLGITNEYTVQLVGQRKGNYQVMTILSGDYISDWVDIHDMFKTYKDIVMVVTYDAPEGVVSYGPYTYEMFKGNRNGHFK